MKFERDRVLKKLRDNILLQVITCIVLSLFVIIFYFVINKYIEKRNFRKYTISKNINLMNEIENVYIENNKIFISGYAFLLEKDADDNQISLLLRNVSTNREIWFNIEQVTRSDINSYFDCEFNYSNSGFIASADADKLINNEVYEVIINIDYNDKFDNNMKRTTVSANQYILNNELYAYNPNEFVKPDLNIKSELLKEVFSEGKLCYYNKEKGLYVYQSEGKLYWIATNDFEFNENGATCIIYHLHTSQINRLPSHRIKYRFDNLDFNFEQFEIKDQLTDPYRVAVRDIPKEYAITYVSTGIFDRVNQKNILIVDFHLKNLQNR